MSQIKAKKLASKNQKDFGYPKFRRVNGQHPLKTAVPNSYVGYSAYARKKGDVYYFNFDLAREMGLIPKSHDNSLTTGLKKAILDTFALQIINEYDVLHNRRIDSEAVKPNQYMATRYLQLQHPNKTGLTSGDGRSMWNGFLKTPKAMWDISSCGTGATRLSPATAIEKKFFKTGDKNVSYGCGLAHVTEGFSGAMMSDIIHRNGIPTERTLAVVKFPDGTSINVRASKNLMRPAHMFGFMRRGDYESLKNAVDYYIEREIYNGNVKRYKDTAKQYQAVLDEITNNFAHAAALFEGEYIFCWMDWDGDNILTDGGIIDYGTIRQFGLFHHEYRYEDVEKYSTNITEQRNKARGTIQTFAQIFDFLLKGKPKKYSAFKNAKAVKMFDDRFDYHFKKHLLHRIGFNKLQQDALLDDATTNALVDKFRRQVRYYEKAMVRRKAYKVADGIMRDAIFCIRDIFRELPVQLRYEKTFYTPREFIDRMASSYATNHDLAPYRRNEKRIRDFQQTYQQLVEQCATITSKTPVQTLNGVIKRSAIINRYEKITGDALIHIGARLTQNRLKLTFKQRTELTQAFIQDQVLDPDSRLADKKMPKPRGKQLQQLYAWLFTTIKKNRSGI